MLIDEKIESLQNLINKKVTYEDIARALDMSGNALRNWVYRNRELKEFEIHKIDNYFKVLTQNNTNYNFISVTTTDRIEINYWQELPEVLKNPKIASVWFDKEIVENAWGMKADHLCIVPMIGDKMARYWYPIRNGDILIIDTSQDYIMGNGVYFGTSQNNSRFWIREMQILINQDIEFNGFAPSGNTSKVYTKEQLEEVDFKLIGKVIKNVSFRL